MTDPYDGTGEYHRLYTQVQKQNQNAQYTHGTVGGTADAITLTLSPAITAYAAGQGFSFVASGTNTGAVTLNVSGLGAKAITKNGTTALAAGDIQSGQTVEVVYDGTQFQMTNVSTADFVTLTTTQTISGTKTFTGEVNFLSTLSLMSAIIKGAVPLVFEGATDNDFETRIAITDPTADRTLSVPDASGEIALAANIPLAATQAEMETATSTTTYVSPGRFIFQPISTKAWINFNGTGTVAIRSSAGVSSVDDLGTGHYRINFGFNFSSLNYCYLFYLDRLVGTSDPIAHSVEVESMSSSAIEIITITSNGTSATAVDAESVNAIFFGDR